MHPPGKLRKLDEMDIASETRSVYKLDPNQDLGNESLHGPLAVARNQGPHNLDSIFRSMDVVDRAQILDKIHKMRMRVADKRGPEEPTKPHLPKMTGNDKDKLMA